MQYVTISFFYISLDPSYSVSCNRFYVVLSIVNTYNIKYLLCTYIGCALITISLDCCERKQARTFKIHLSIKGWKTAFHRENIWYYFKDHKQRSKRDSRQLIFELLPGFRHRGRIITRVFGTLLCNYRNFHRGLIWGGLKGQVMFRISQTFLHSSLSITILFILMTFEARPLGWIEGVT